MQLFWNAMAKFLLGILLVGLLLFGFAGTFSYPNAWLLMGALFLPMIERRARLCRRFH